MNNLNKFALAALCIGMFASTQTGLYKWNEETFKTIKDQSPESRLTFVALHAMLNGQESTTLHVAKLKMTRNYKNSGQPTIDVAANLNKKGQLTFQELYTHGLAHIEYLVSLGIVNQEGIDNLDNNKKEPILPLITCQEAIYNSHDDGTFTINRELLKQCINNTSTILKARHDK
jgi:hypothetical protein